MEVRIDDVLLLPDADTQMPAYPAYGCFPWLAGMQ